VTLFLIVPFLGDGSSRAPLDALSTFFIPKLETVFFMITIFFLTGGQFQKGDHTPQSYGHPFGSDKTIIEAEGPKTAGIGDMAF
jgi:hypothetical protein